MGNQSDQVDFKEMKIKIYDICKMIFEEQKTAGMQLKQIELKVQKIRDNFTKVMIEN